MSPHPSDPFTAVALVELSVHRLGERTCVINVGTDLRTSISRVVDDAVRGVTSDDCRDLVFDLTYLHRYERTRWCGSPASGTGWPRRAARSTSRARGARGERPRAARRPDGWELHVSTTHALRALLSAPVA
jgi:hypothetical protein